ncbi:hypothetical protein Acsp04_67020 [Actinomadura sp. NBRC 104425]|nr:hypothetical protein Acsp04_67020 [Actinomadura sp. NBRC 104425]
MIGTYDITQAALTPEEQLQRQKCDQPRAPFPMAAQPDGRMHTAVVNARARLGAIGRPGPSIAQEALPKPRQRAECEPADEEWQVLADASTETGLMFRRAVCRKPGRPIRMVTAVDCDGALHQIHRLHARQPSTYITLYADTFTATRRGCCWDPLSSSHRPPDREKRRSRAAQCRA